MKTITLDNAKWLYIIFTLNALLFVTIFQDIGWAGASLCLALAFSPFGDTKFQDLKIHFKILVIGQTLIGLALIIMNFLEVIID